MLNAEPVEALQALTLRWRLIGHIFGNIGYFDHGVVFLDQVRQAE